ncbi:HNH endonuclease [Frigoribacterium sp. VKM Ac-2836]|uniref:HNH endonuclease n=1 Tax=Frigoribacterium sp. VKM Ac-2836 TaxID=2739014 RepID=UPI0015668E43|nr:HNH endonuclease [Frigoribacterium sp. VKM Ac-2836]
MSQYSSSGPEWQALRLQVLARDNHQCQWCGKPDLAGADATVDHLISRKSGGEDSLTNCITSCRSCNSIKGANELVRMAGYNPKYLDHL